MDIADLLKRIIMVPGLALVFGIWPTAEAALPAYLHIAVRALHQGDTATAVRHLLPLAKRGDGEAQFMLVSAFQASDPQQAGHWLRMAAGSQHPDACHILGLMYLHGDGVASDPLQAVRWLRIAAQAGNTAAQMQLGDLYRNGPNAMQDDREAAKWLTQAATAGHAEAQFQLAQMYRYGYAVAADAGEMNTWLQRAAAQGHEAAARMLAAAAQ